ncbi:putative methyltransferase WBSCR22 [Melipona quadrifasciata]|uniref:Putative methyltransferase WBSCR22 n=1 Tax=Melipona quadrifasciata TaxID=166423 RepID=A0A0N0BBK8_9HYME|nr:putative methyltransferase WBSCR22 [Melipona quadrifasciata]
MSRRPEHLAPPELFYDETEARKYTHNNAIDFDELRSKIQVLKRETYWFKIYVKNYLTTSLVTNLIQTLFLKYDMLFLEEILRVALEREVGGDLILGDMGQGMPFKAGTFDGAISISALQWLCNADKNSHDPLKRLYKFFSTLFSCLSRSARAVFQFYPENSEQIELITTQATKAGFYGGVVVDFPNSTKAKKYFLVLMTGGAAVLPRALSVNETDSVVPYASRREQMKKAKGKYLKNSKDWIIEKKERRRKQGKKVSEDSKYTGRRRCGRF